MVATSRTVGKGWAEATASADDTPTQLLKATTTTITTIIFLVQYKNKLDVERKIKDS